MASALVCQRRREGMLLHVAARRDVSVSVSKIETIRSKDEISRIFHEGRYVKTAYVTFIVEHGQSGRVAFIAGKKLGGAVVRNRLKRRLRSLCRDLGGPWQNYDVIFLAKSALKDANYSKVLKSCEQLRKKEPLVR